ncbi:hypothetical protein ACFQY0_07100 [Haloferula chungangensis]|uniref:Uncharacterized protein n=1 Tax=Haloferula chungangensis TaxID=1048331 RepID=A0ABW2L5B8_9BACT
MSNHFDGAFHWDFSPISDRLALLDALTVFYDEDTNLFIEVVSSSLLQRLRFWHMRSPYRTHLTPDILSPRPSTFHIGLTKTNLEKLKRMVAHDGLNERCIAHI